MSPIGKTTKALLFILCAFCTLWAALPQVVFAHASLEEASPAPDARYASAPAEVALRFNERLEKELYSIKVLDQDGDYVTSAAAEMNQTQTELRLPLPELDDGIYTVAYRVISADGHPISESYVFTVGDRTASALPASEPNPPHEHGISSELTLRQILLFASRMLYFSAFVMLAGLTFWGLFAERMTAAGKAAHLTWSLRLQRLFLPALLAMIAAQIPDYMDRPDAGQLAALLFGTAAGISWIGQLGLAFLGFFLLHRWRWATGLWLTLLLISRSISGHAMAYEPAIRTVALDVVHLAAASVWAGGLLLLLVLWRNDSQAAHSFLPQFSAAALVSLVVLTATGIASTLLFLPHLKYVLYTQWGMLLIAKCVLVIAVIAAGAVLRYLARKKRSGIGWMLKADFGLMLLIAAIVGVFTYLSPQPVNEPLYWHVMGDKVHMTAKIAPKAPGDNTFTVEVWLPETSGEPKTVSLSLNNRDNPDVAPIKVPLALVPDEVSLDFIEFKRYTFQSAGPYLPFAGRWQAEIRVMDADDNETVYEKEMMIY